MSLYSKLPKFDEVTWRRIEDDEFDRLKERFPSFDRTVCPTCLDTKEFRYRNRKWDCDCQTQKTLAAHYLYANISKTYHTLGFDDLRGDKEELGALIRSYIANWDQYKRYGRGLVFTGSMGTGKTFAQVLILKELIKKGEKVWFTTFKDAIAAYLDPELKQELWREIQSSAFLAVDEITQPVSDTQGNFLGEVLEWLVRYRVENSLPTSLATNMKTIGEAFPRVGSLISMTYLEYHLEGEDARKTTSKEEIDELIFSKQVRPIK